MLTKLIVRNFKRFGEVEIELGNPVVFVGPNNSGKTSALQALALWEVGLKRWNEKRKGKTTPEKRSGVTINRKDLVAIPIPDADLLWRNLRTRDVQRNGGKQQTKNIRIEVVVEGVVSNRAWQCGIEFDYANQESLYCRPLRLSDGKAPERMAVPEEVSSIQVSFLPPMSGLSSNETRLDPGAINVRIGEGRTAEVLRNLCYLITSRNSDQWKKLVTNIENLFGAQLEEPEYVAERGEIVMSYRERGTRLDLSSSGRGLQQTLLVLAYMYANPGAVLLLDEPDAHLETLRQGQTYQLLVDIASENGNQIVAASHSEVLLNEAGGRDVVIAFVGTPHRIDDRGSQVRKSLSEIGFDQYYQAEMTRWVLYLEGSTDLAILRAFAERLDHQQARKALERPFVHYVGNQPNEVRKHFHGLREAVPDLKGVAIFDRLEQDMPADLGALGLQWTRREAENYLCHPHTLEAYATAVSHVETEGPLFEAGESEKRLDAMRWSVQEVEGALDTLGKESPWTRDAKVSDDFLVPVFQKYFQRLGLPNIMAKKSFHELARFVPRDKIDEEVREKLDAITEVAEAAQPPRDIS